MSAPHRPVEELLDKVMYLNGGPLSAWRLLSDIIPWPARQQVVGAVRAGGAQRAVQREGLGGRDDAVVVTVQEQERWRVRPDQVDRVGVGGPVSVDRMAGIGDSAACMRRRTRRPRGQVGCAELVYDRT